MEETTTSRFDPRVVLAAVAVAFAAAAIWAATALAAGGSSGAPELVSGGSGGPSPASVFVQGSTDDAAPSRDDCPEHGGAGGDTTAPDGSGSSGDAL